MSHCGFGGSGGSADGAGGGTGPAAAGGALVNCRSPGGFAAGFTGSGFAMSAGSPNGGLRSAGFAGGLGSVLAVPARTPTK